MSVCKRTKPDDGDGYLEDIDDEEFLSAATVVENAANRHSKRLKTNPVNDPRLMDLLQNKFRLTSFRLAQEQVITRLIHGDSATVVFPTGGGKSLCYQLTALAIEGLTIVVSPLIALMKDQTEVLKRRGIMAESLDSTKSREEYLATMEIIKDGSLKLLFVAPERLNNEGFVETMMSLRDGVSLVAIDEAHCISEWGHAFRPDYLKVARFVEEIGAKRVVCLTATATPKVASDICRIFGIDESVGLFRTSSFRSNLQLLVESISTSSKFHRLVDFLKVNVGTSIIYVTAQKQSEELSHLLRIEGFTSSAYHAGMMTQKRIATQNAFMKVKNIVIVATIAFGMGIDKSDIRNVVHYDIPRSLEGYSQEIGRAGRDGKPSSCLLFLCGEDILLRENMARGDLPSPHNVHRLLQELFSCHSTAPVGTILEAKKASQSKRFDMRPTSLGNIYAQLELREKVVREITPRYGNYEYQALQAHKLHADSSPEGSAINSFSQTRNIWTDIDVSAAASSTCLKRSSLVRKLQQWNDSGIIELKASQVINRFRTLKALPSSKQEIDAIADASNALLKEREEEEIGRYKAVVSWATASKCFAAQLAVYFGDSIPGDKCGNCTFCQNQTAVEFISVKKQRTVDKERLDRIAQACGKERDPRMMARVAFGISSPKITELRLSKSAVFGSITDCDFEDLLEECKKRC